MRVTVDAVPLLYRSAGVKNYLYYWIEGLLRAHGELDVRLFPLLRMPGELNHETALAGPVAAFLRLGAMFALNRVPFDFSRWIGPRPDVFHASRLLYPPRRARLTATLYDMTCWLMPELHTPVNVAGDYAMAARVWKRADRLIAISEATRQDAVRALNLDPTRIDVIYPGVAEAFFRATGEDARKTRERLRLERPYLLFVSTIEPRKNVGTLLDAYLALPASLREEFDLALAGPAGWREPQTMARLSNPPAGVRYLGYSPEREMPGLFAGATALVYPSLYEGFGFPAAQAMAAGAPVVTSAVSSLPEITGGAAELVDPRSQAELTAALERVLTSPTRRAEMIAAGRKQAQRFTWEECVRKSVSFFQSVA
jgi:glycosyltransferase involved in cell wall biosynthesis